MLGSSLFSVCVSLGQMRLKKETGGTEVERSHEKNKKKRCKTQSTICAQIWGVEGEDSTVQLPRMTWFSSAKEML